jgi:hypothetical protein
MKTQLRPGERIAKEGAANLQKSIETVGGRVWLTNQRLIFEAHKVNIQGGTTALELPHIQSSRPCWTKSLGIIPLFPNSLAVLTQAGKEYRFVVRGRQSWAAAISAQQTRRNA